MRGSEKWIENKAPLATLLVITGLAAVLRLFDLGVHSLWLDEMGQVIAASGSWQHLFKFVTHHLSPPLDYVITKAFLAFGDSEWIVRLPAFVAGVCAVPLTYVFARRVATEETALLASVFLAVAPEAIAYSQEARMYSLFLLLSILSFWLVSRFTEKRSWARALTLGMANGLLLLTHYFAFFILGTEFLILGVFLYRNRSFAADLPKVVVSLVLAGVMFLPWVPGLLYQLRHSNGQIWYGLGTNPDYWKDIFSSLSSNTGEGFWYCVFIGLFVIGLIGAAVKKQYVLVVLALSFLGILGGLYFLSFFKRIVTTRNLIFLLPIYLILCAEGIRILLVAGRIPSRIGMLMIVALMGWPVYYCHFSGRPDYKPEWKGAIEYLGPRLAPGEKIITTEIYSRGCLGYYLDRHAEYSFMQNRWMESRNDPRWRIWALQDDTILAITAGQVRGWFVMPPILSGVPDPETMRERLRKILPQPSMIFKTQGRGRPLAIYRLEPAPAAPPAINN